MTRPTTWMPALFALAFFGVANVADAQVSFADPAANGAWDTARWNNSDGGPYTSTFTEDDAVSFTTGPYSFAGGMGDVLSVGNVAVAPGVQVTFSTTPALTGTYATGGSVQTVDVGAGGLFDLNGQAVSIAAGTGFTKTGSGVFGTGAGGFTGGFTLSSGVVVARGVTGLGSGGTLALNGGTITGSGNRDFPVDTFTGITIGGDVQFGAYALAVPLSTDGARVTFADNANLGGARRTLTLGNNGNQRFSGEISNGSLTFAAVPLADGRFDITGTANTFTGNINVNGGEVRFTADGSLGAVANSIVIDGGRFGIVSNGAVTLGASRNVSVGDTAGTGISAPGTGTLTITNPIADIAGKTGFLAKQGGGTLVLGGVSTYSGDTLVNNGILRLSGNDRLPTSTFMRIGQAGSTNVGTLNLDGNNQTVAGLASTSGINASLTANNTVTSATAATLTVALATGTAIYGDGTAANSGRITGAVSLVKSGAGLQVLGGANTYTGTTLVSGGTLQIEGVQTGPGLVTVASGGTLGGDGGIGGSLLVASGGNLLFDTTNTLTVSGSSISFGGFGIANLVGLSQSTPDGLYALLDGIATLDSTNLSNVGAGNAFDLGGGKTAYFTTGSGLSVAVVPEPSTVALAISAGLGLAGLAARRRLRKA